MITFRQFRRFFLIASLAVLITTTVTITFTPSQSWVATTLIPFFSQSQTNVAMNEDDTISQNIEDKTQEANENITREGISQINL
jgi:hypothetical protein